MKAYRIVIDLGQIGDSNQIKQWYGDSIGRGIIPTFNLDGTEAYVDVYREGSPDFGKLALWLKDYGKYIDYNKSNAAIVEIHEVQKLTILKSYKWIEFKNNFVNSTDLMYKKYLKMSGTITSSFSINLIDDHQQKHTFSVQLFESIGNIKNIKDDDIITFYYNPSNDDYMFYIGAFYNISIPPLAAVVVQ